MGYIVWQSLASTAVALLFLVEIHKYVECQTEGQSISLDWY
jgi:hypothetical protein